MRRVNKSRWYQQKMLSKTFNKEWSTYIQNSLTNDLEDLKINLLLAKPDLISKLTSVTKRSKWYLGYGFLQSTFIVQASLKQNLHKAGTSSLDQAKLAFANFHESTHCVKVSIFGVILVRIFLHLDWIRRDTPYLSVFSPNAGKCGPE